MKIQKKLLKFNGDSKVVEERLKYLGKFNPEDVLVQFGISQAEFDNLCLENPTIKVHVVARVLAKCGGELKAAKERLKKKAMKKALSPETADHIQVFVQYLKAKFPNLKEELLKRRIEKFLLRLDEKNSETKEEKEADLVK